MFFSDPRNSMDIHTAGMVSDDEDEQPVLPPQNYDEDDLMYKAGSNRHLTQTQGNTPKNDNNINIAKLYNPKAEGMLASSMRLINNDNDFNLDKANGQDTPHIIDVNEDTETDEASTTDGNEEDIENDANIVYDESSSNIKPQNHQNNAATSSDSDDDIYDSANEPNSPIGPNGDNSPK